MRGATLKPCSVFCFAPEPVETYDHLDEIWLEAKPFALRVMLGREDMLGSTTIARGGADYRLLPRTFTWAKTRLPSRLSSVEKERPMPSLSVGEGSPIF